MPTNHQVKIIVLDAQINVLKEHIEHPGKPGYKRQDILEKIEILEQERESCVKKRKV